jgi:dTDP-6-deoxy-L-talose 4-dehydrogenase (NAD+)
MRVLITGATGFIGSHAALGCQANGWEVGALVLPAEVSMCRERLGQSVAVFPGTLAEPPWPALEAWQPDACIHCAWIATPGEYLTSPLNTDFLRWSRIFLERLAANGTRRLVGVGTCAERLVPLQGNGAPLYARCKDELRQFMLDGIPGAQCAWARLFYPYGVGEARQRLISSLIAAFQAGRSFPLRCTDTRKDYVHVADVGSAMAALARFAMTGLVEIGTGTGVRLGDLAAMVAARMGCPERLVLGDETDPLGDMIADPELLHALGWSATVPLDRGVAAMVEQAEREVWK